MTTATAGYQGSSLAEIVNCDLIFTTTTTSLCSKYSKFSSKLPSVLFRTLEEDLDLLESVIKTQKKIVSSVEGIEDDHVDWSSLAKHKNRFVKKDLLELNAAKEKMVQNQSFFFFFFIVVVVFVTVMHSSLSCTLHCHF